jgi:hypothetical protein
MSIYGSNSFVIEGANGTEICNKIMKTFDICVELDTRYKIGEVNGKVYTIEKSKTEYAYPDGMEYVFSVWDKDDNHNNGFKRPLAYSWIHPLNIKLKDGNLWISESWCNSDGVLRYYIRDVKLHKQTNVYFMTSCEADIVGVTNDSEGKYFKRYCYCECICEMPDNYGELPLAEQVSFCEALEAKGEEVYYDVTRIIETEKFFG